VCYYLPFLPFSSLYIFFPKQFNPQVPFNHFRLFFFKHSVFYKATPGQPFSPFFKGFNFKFFYIIFHTFEFYLPPPACSRNIVHAACWRARWELLLTPVHGQTAALVGWLGFKLQEFELIQVPVPIWMHGEWSQHWYYWKDPSEEKQMPFVARWWNGWLPWWAQLDWSIAHSKLVSGCM
jgi:hypothetical protein